MLLLTGEEDPIFFAEYFLGVRLNPFQKRALLSLCKRKPNFLDRFVKQILWVTANQVGKSQWIEEPVLTPNGFIRMGDIKIGSKVYSQNGKETKVIGVYPQGKRKLYKMIFDDNSFLIVDEEHLWKIKTPFNRFLRKKYKTHKQKEWKLMTTKELIDRWGMNPKPTNRIEIPMTEPVEFKKKKIKIEPYLLGLLLGDGCFRKKGSPMFSTVDTELLNAFGKIKHKDKCDYQLYDLAKPIKELGLYNKKSWEKFIPKDYLLNDVKTRLSILQGLMDTDGSIYGKCIMEYSTTSKQLSNDVKFLVQSLGGKVKITSRYTWFIYKGKKKKGRKSYRIIIKMQNLCPFRLKRKANKFYKINRTKNRILHKIEYFGKKDAQCIKVDNLSHLYLAKDFIVTHNTVTLAISHIWFNFYKKGFNGDPDLIEQARYETLNISPVSRQATEAFRYVEEILHSQFCWEFEDKRDINKCKIGWFWEGKNENIGRIDFSNNSSFWCLSTAADKGSGLAGKQFGYISYDECVQSHHLEDELGARIFSRTAKYSGWIVLVSTPDEMGKSQQYWYHLYTDAKREQKEEVVGEWLLLEGLYDENVFIPQEKRDEFKERLKKISPQKYLQVVEGSFLDSADRMFSLKVVEGIWNGKEAPTEVISDREYVVVVDWGVADSGDETVIGVGDVTDVENVELVHTWSKQGGDPVELMAMASYLVMNFNDAPLVMDAAEMGGVIFKKMMRQFKPISFGQGNKPDALIYLQLRLRGNIRGKQNLTSSEKSVISKLKSYYIPKLERQLSSYKLEDKKIKQDWVMVFAMLAWYIEKYKKVSQVKSFNLNKFYNR